MSRKVDKEKNQHIQVFVRCRPINGKEKKQGAFNVVEVNDKEVHVKDRSTATAPTKTFSFDKVYGPQSKQIDVHKQVVSPLVEEVLSGYNCTVFAYGQTGTGKTFTMEGERTEKQDLSWEDDPLAGIIPRAMHQLFTHLTLMGCEFSVRVSFLEIYNEELIDLLGAESVENPRLRIYEDSARKGSCIIQGLEEVVVRNKDEVYKIMALGSERRQTAATQMNAHSSRSHSLFMVTVHIKENSVDGEEMLKTGKLNLVDLAGSECIGRSGAIDKRAREAGNINQSLLTLGRVITALVEHAPHVPYRESKLTRLLQDSLGGRTKTSIIATISPASLNLDETLSTLDYAFRAKNITNRPEINQRLSKKTLLKEYNEEIERLRRDLQAARDKNGVFLAQENYDEMQTKIQQQRDSILDLTERMAMLTSEMMKIQDMFTETKEELACTTEELTETKGDLSHTKDVLDRTRLNYQVTLQDRDEQRYLVTTHVKSETQLSAEATSLLSTANDATTDVDGLHAKLDRKRKVEQHNEAVIENFRVSFRKNIDDMKNNLKDFTAGQIKSASTIKSAVGDMGARRAEEVTALCQDLGQMETMLASRLSKLEEREEARIAANKKWSTDICTDCLQTEDDQETQEHTFHEQTFLASVLKIHTSLKQRYDSLQELDALRQSQMEMQQAQFTQFAEEMEERLKLQADLAASVTTAVDRSLTQHKEQLQHTIDSQNTLNQQLEDQLITSLRQKVREMITSQQTNLESNAKQLEKTGDKMSADVQTFSDNSTQGLQESLSASQRGVANVQELTTKHNTALHDTITKESAHLQTIMDDRKTLETDVTTFKLRRKENHSKRTKLIIERVEHHMASLSDAHDTFKDGMQSATKECSTTVDMLKQGQTTQQAALISDVTSQQGQLDSLSDTVSGWSESMAQSMEDRDTHVEKLLTEETQKDLPTGTTPQARDFIYPRDLTRTQRHSMILQEFRRNYVTRDVAELPLPNNSFDSVSSEVSPLDLDADIDTDGHSVDQNASADSAISTASFTSVSTVGDQDNTADLPKDASEEGKENSMKPPKMKTVPKTTRTTQDRSRSRSQSSRDTSLNRKTPKKVAPSTSSSKTPTATAVTQRQSRTRLPLRTANSTN